MTFESMLADMMQELNINTIMKALILYHSRKNLTDGQIERLGRKVYLRLKPIYE